MDAEKTEAAQETMIRLPTGLVMGPNALARRFGRRPITDEASHRPGHIVTVSSGVTQLDFFHPHIIRAKTLDAAITAAGQVMTNRVWRTFLCCLGAMEEDQLDKGPLGTLMGAFYYAPSRFCDLFGFGRVGAADRHPDARYDAMDANMDALGKIAIETRIRRKNGELKITADRLVYYAHASVEETRTGEGPGDEGSEDRAGRRKLLLYRVNDHLLRRTSIEDYFSPIPLKAIAAPLGVGQGVWDDAVKVLCDLSAYARVNARKARRADGRPWRLRLDELAERTNISANSRPDKVRLYARNLLGELQRVGLVDFGLSGAGDAEMVSYDVIGRDVLSRIKSRTASKFLRTFAIQPGRNAHIQSHRGCGNAHI